ncbi:MAG: hypothetical protein AVO33_00300 [delta proteobacterium ML8_F1]|nr:MAG: hypothetical protein AVO33_00300 [delta proteobacterium ML8_F1]
MKYRIHASRIIPCDSEKVIENGFVDFEGRQIKGVGKTEDVKSVKFEGKEINYPGCTIIPGLVNSHDHLVTKSKYTSWTLDVVKSEAIPYQSIRALRNAENILREGVTTLRECGCRERINIAVSRANMDGLVTTPDIIACGRPISIIGGHCSYYSYQISSEHEGIAAVRTELMHGADFIKVHATGGAGTKEGSPEWRQLTLDELKAIVDEAHASEKRVCSHAIGREGIKNSILAGVDSIEHGHYLDEELLEMMVEKGIYYVPTLTGYIPLALKGLEMGRPQWMVDNAMKLLNKHQEVMETIKKYPEIIMATGSDSSGSVAEEAEEMYNVGFSPIQILIFATRNGADVLDVLDRKGTIECDKDADMVVIEGDPLKNIKDLKMVKQVIKGGKFISPLAK